MRALIVILGLGLAACTPPAETPSTPETPAEPAALTLSSEGYGPARIGMTIEEAEAALGQDLGTGAGSEPSECQIYAPEPGGSIEGLRFMVQQGRITRISDNGSPNLRTPEGVGVGSTDAEVRAAYPNATEEPAKYDPAPAHSLTTWTTPNERGIRFHVNAQGVVTSMDAGDESILLVEGCS